MTNTNSQLIFKSGDSKKRSYNFSNKTLHKKKCVKQSPLYGVAIHYSEKHQSVHQIKNTERDYAVLLDWSDDVLTYSSNVKLCAVEDGKALSHRFSFLVHYNDRQVLTDVASSLSRRNTDKRVYKNIETIATQNNLEYEFVTTESIQGTFLRNVMHVRTALSQPSPENEFKEFCSNATDQHANVLEAQNELRAQGKNPDLIRQFVAHGLVSANLQKPWQDIEISWEAA